ncbi:MULTISPECIES: DUF3961 domain-containing protein [Bacillus cereus group]|uniref:DUF3961 domain-containing protein n=1 Tax=Bacillus cereus group TaxID=86661 RepID=UPI0028BD76F9|nr:MULTISPECIES: DUF3961 domain-containing protein [Bacillus cereus group]
MPQKILLINFGKFKNLNRYFGIEENVSDQIWFYGFFATSVFMMLFTYLVSGILYGF